ncbi:MAG: hypothetical protein E7374_00375 [Clostridiales bacterium]|nr:hypothetical protein [Clostridiales bacterium]
MDLLEKTAWKNVIEDDTDPEILVSTYEKRLLEAIKNSGLTRDEKDDYYTTLMDYIKEAPQIKNILDYADWLDIVTYIHNSLKHKIEKHLFNPANRTLDKYQATQIYARLIKSFNEISSRIALHFELSEDLDVPVLHKSRSLLPKFDPLTF